MKVGQVRYTRSPPEVIVRLNLDEAVLFLRELEDVAQAFPGPLLGRLSLYGRLHQALRAVLTRPARPEDG